MEKEEVKRLILEQGLTVMRVIDALVEMNGLKGVGLVSLGVDLKTYCVEKVGETSSMRNLQHLTDLHVFNEQKRIRMIVIDGHTLGYMDEGAITANVLSASVLKGSTLRDGDIVHLSGRQVRTAKREDFENFRVSVDGYLQDKKYIIAD